MSTDKSLFFLIIRKMIVYAPMNQQPKLGRSKEEMSEVRKVSNIG